MTTRAGEQELLHDVADAVGGLMELWGFKRVLGRLWAVLYVEAEPLSAAELTERLDLSVGAVSMGLGELERWGVVRRLRRAGDRREFFEAETDVWKMVSRVLRERELSEVEHATGIFERAKASLAAPGASPRMKRMSERVGKLADLARLGGTLLGAMLDQGRLDASPLMRFASTFGALGRKR